MLLQGSGRDSGAFKAPDGGDPQVPAAITDTGCERDLNEDRYAVIESESGIAWIVCDGMGGEMGGELAAQLAIDAIRRDLEHLPQRPPAQAIKGAVLEANRIIVLRRQNPAFAGMGTTVVTAIFSGREIAVCNAGDSRAYCIRDGAIKALTTDHTYVQELVDKGEITTEQALSHPQAHVLTRCIGSEPALEIDIERYWVWDCEPGEKNDVLLLCTDGLYSHVTDEEIANELSASTPQRACVNLVEMAKSRGGYDNITVAIVPLDGQLRSEPPKGYVEEVRKRSTKSRKAKTKEPINLVRRFGLIALLSALAALLTFAFILFQATR